MQFGFEIRIDLTAVKIADLFTINISETGVYTYRLKGSKRASNMLPNPYWGKRAAYQYNVAPLGHIVIHQALVSHSKKERSLTWRVRAFQQRGISRIARCFQEFMSVAFVRL